MLESDCALYIDQGRLTGAIFIDLRKAFDTVNQVKCRQVPLEFGNSGYCGLPILKGNEILITIHAAVITVDLKTVERAT